MIKEKSIETSSLLIKGNIMSWDGTMIQLSNVSCISTEALVQKEFPMLSLLLFVIGIFMWSSQKFLAFILIAACLAWIGFWYYMNNMIKKNTILNINMNSGNNLRFVFNNKNFLEKVLQVLEEIIIEGGVGGSNVSINIRGCTITGNAKVLNDFNV